MSTASRAAYAALDEAESLKYGDYSVTKDWQLASGATASTSLVFNPNDPTQNFQISNSDQASQDELQYYLGGVKNGSILGQYYPTGGYNGTLDQIANLKLQSTLTPQVSAGTITPDAATAQVNAAPAPAPETLYQQTYNATKAEEAARPIPGSVLNPTYDRTPASGRISSRQLEPQSDINYSSPGYVMGVDGKQYKLGSAEYTNYLLSTPVGQAATVQGGATSGTPRTSTTSGGTSNTNTSGYTTSPSTTTLTPTQSKLQTMIEQIMKDNNILAGAESYEKTQEELQEIAKKEQLVSDLSNKLMILQQEAAVINATTQTGEGVTTAIDQRQRAEKLRLNSVESLQINAQLASAKGNLATAEYLVEKAVEAKYGKIEAERDALMANYDLILKSPLYTQEEKNQAAALKAAEEAKALTTDTSKAVYSNILSLISDAQYQLYAPQSVKSQINSLLQKTTLTQADEVMAMNLAAQYTAAPKTGSGTDNPVTAIEQQKYYPDLPSSVIGMSEEQIIADLQSSAPPTWYFEMLRSQGLTLTDLLSVGAKWTAFRQNALEQLQGQLQKGTPDDEPLY